MVMGYIRLWQRCINVAITIMDIIRSRSYFTTDGQSASMCWYRAPLWDLRPDITFSRNVAVWNLRSCFYGAPSLTRGRVCNLQCNHPSRAEPVTILYCLIWDSPNLEGQVPIFISPRNRVAQLYPLALGWTLSIVLSFIYCPYLTRITLRLSYEPDRLMLSIRFATMVY
jgi:hypothetical protein